MAFLITEESHLDHGLDADHIHLMVQSLKSAPAILTIKVLEIPSHMRSLYCALRGPAVGDPPVPEGEVFYRARDDRKWDSRMTRMPQRKVRVMTIIAGPDEGHPGHLVLYTAYGGPLAPREPGDPSIQDDPVEVEKSKAFWAEHALCL